ncbi:MAG: holo-ACP synthase [Tissierella sp.]|uniref:holo-ACP synthase n=1 Tax=Tissierella sp. TaxID=41274 RepID=UPI003F976652
MKTGVDIVEVKRIKKILESKKDPFYKKIFTHNEIKYIKSKKHNPKTVAGLFACKEAVSKMLGTGIGVVGWRDIEILHDKNNRPYINIKSRVNNFLKKNGLNHIEVSISHEKSYAISFAIGFLK